MEDARRVAAVEAALGSEDLAGARAALARLGELAPEHLQLRALTGRLEEAEARRARRARVTEIAASVRELLSRDDVEAAERAVEEALALDGEDAEARALSDRVRARREERAQAQRARLEWRVAHAQARLASGDLAGAIARFEEVLAETPSHEAAARGLAEARSRRAAQEAREAAAAKHAALDARVAEAQARMASGDLIGAIERLEAVLRDDAAHVEARRGLGEARERRAAIEAQEAAAGRQAALEARVAEGRLRLTEGDVVGAIEQFEAVLAEDGSHAEAQRGLAAARQRLETLEGRLAEARRRAAIEARVAAARLRLSAGNVVGAIERFEAVLTEDEGHTEARRDLAEARGRLEAIEGRGAAAARRATLEAHAAQARARLTSGDLIGAIEGFEGVLRDDRTHVEAQRGLGEAREQRAAREAQEKEAARRAALDARVAEAQARLAVGDLTGAIGRFEAVLRDDAAHAEAHRQLAEARKRWAATEARVAEAQARLASGDLAGGIERFQAVLRDDGTHAAARRGLAEASTRRAAQQARETEVATALSTLETTLQAQDVESVQSALAWLVDLAPEHPQMASLRDRIAEHRERVEEDREQGAREALAEAGRFVREGKLEPALESLVRARALAPQHPDLSKLERQAQRMVAARGERVRALIASARDLLSRDDLDAAQRALLEALGIDARHPEVLAAQEHVQARRREIAEAHVAELVAAVQTALAGPDLTAAETAFARLRELAPAHPALVTLQERIQTRREHVDPELLVKNALEEAARLIREMRPERVPEVLARVRKVAPQHPGLAKLEAQAQKVLGARDVRVRVRELVDRARQLQFRGKHAEALALAEEAVGLAPDDGPTLRLRDDLAEQIQGARRPGRPR